MEEFFEPGRDILIARDSADTLDALALPDEHRRRIARSARERTLDCHTAAIRAAELEAMLCA